MYKYVITGLIAVCMVSCGGKSDGISPEPADSERWVQSFTEPFELWGDVNLRYTDADVAAIIQGPLGVLQPIGTVWEHGESRWSVASCLREGLDGNHIIQYRFLGEGVTEDHVSPPLTFNIADRDIRFPKVAACYFYDPLFPFEISHTLVEVTLVFQVWNDVLQRWDLGIQILRFDPDDFVVGSLENIEPSPLVPVPLTTFSDFEYTYPDVAYEPLNGRIVVVYCKNNYLGMGMSHIWYRKAGRGHPFSAPPYWATYDFIAQDPLMPPHNGFHPRLDIGWIQFGTPQEEWMLALAYTGAHDYRWRVWINYWEADTFLPQTVNDRELLIPDPDYKDLGAGLPVVDIGPPGSNFAAIVWNQANDIQSPHNWENVSVAYMDSWGCWCLFDPFQEEPLDRTWSSYPSLSVHDSAPFDPRVSVSYLHRHQVDSEWWPSMRWVEPDPGNPVDMGNRMQFVSLVYGDWDALDCIDAWLGMTTALIVYPGNQYWMLWTSMLVGEVEPRRIHGAYGFTE